MNIGHELPVRRASPSAFGILAFALVITSLSHAQSPTATDPSATAPTAKNPAAQNKPKKAAKKKEEPEEEWILLPEPVKSPSAAASVPDSAPTAGASPAAASASISGAAPSAASPPAAASATAAPSAPAAGSPAAAAEAPSNAAPGQAPAAAPNGGEQRLALVIGNSSYKTGRLPNSGNDAHSMSAMLQQLGWQVIELEDVGRDEMKKAAEDFGNRLA
jgi:hypothetical protein